MTSEVETVQDSRAEKPRRKSRGIKLFIRDILLIFLAALLISFLIKTFFIRSFYIPSGSMMDTLQINDRIIVNLMSPGLVPLKNGDVVVFKDPGGWLTATPPQPKGNAFVSGFNDVLAFVGLSAPDSNDHLVKRIIGLPGDHVKCCNAFGQLIVNGVPLDEPYIKLPPGVTKDAPEDFDVTVPKGKLWVMGDNRYNSDDSAMHHVQDPSIQYVPISDVVGRAVVISWPISRWAVLDDYPVVFRDVDKSK
ncbi:MAG: lepB [Glaciihabitans sp.]|jgi:signal peptidase I|nr:lepB [Glaciihabitans sp.]MDQ1571372.1 signal peptidase [Actinomycetota bacterium]